jgi:hypothetical protein
LKEWPLASALLLGPQDVWLPRAACGILGVDVGLPSGKTQQCRRPEAGAPMRSIGSCRLLRLDIGDPGCRRSGAEVAGRRREGPSTGMAAPALFRREARKSWPHAGRAFPLPATVWARAPGRGRSSYGRIVAGESGNKGAKQLLAMETAMNGERYPGEILPFEPSMVGGPSDCNNLVNYL